MCGSSCIVSYMSILVVHLHTGMHEQMLNQNLRGFSQDISMQKSKLPVLSSDLLDTARERERQSPDYLSCQRSRVARAVFR